MIIKTIKVINSVEYEYTYSDAGMMIERNGARYAEACDPIGSCREYVETDEPIESEELSDIITDEEFVDMLEEVL